MMERGERQRPGRPVLWVRRRLLVTTLLFAVAASGLWRPATADTGPLQPGQPFADFGMEQLNLRDSAPGKLVWLHHYVGPRAKHPKRLVLLNFFAAWCEPCKRDLPELARWQRSYAEHGLQVLAVHADSAKQPMNESIARIAAMMRELDLDPPFPILMERIDRNKVLYMGRVATLPCSVLIQSDGMIVERFQGKDHDMVRLEASVRQRLERPR